MLNKIKKNKLRIIVIALLLLLVICFWSIFLWQKELLGLVIDLSEYLKNNKALEILRTGPLYLYTLAILILPLLALPVSPIYLLAGARTEPLIEVFLFCIAGNFLCMIFAYFIAKKFSDKLMPWFESKKIKIPKLSEKYESDFIFLLRMIPGNPFAVQNYLLGAANVNLKKYILISFPIQFVQVFAYISFSDGVINAQLNNFLMGISLLLVLAIIARLVQKRLNNKNEFFKTK